MESWLPWMAPQERLLTDLLPPPAQVVLVEPRRLRERAADIAAEEADLARSLAVRWGRDTTKDFPALHLPFDRLLATTEAAAWTLTSVPESPDVATVTAVPWEQAIGGGERLVAQL